MKNFLFAAVFTAVLISGCSRPAVVQETIVLESEDPVALILNHYATRNFIEGTIPADDLDIIVQSGVRAPSAGNRQPWHFTVVLDQELAQQIVPANVDGNVLIVASAVGDGTTNGVQILDCALAIENMYLAAQALGYGSRIYTGPMNNLNSNFKEALSLPADHSAVGLVRVGRVEGGVDAVSAASPRKDAEEVVTYKR